MGVTGRLKNAEDFMFGDINNERGKHFFGCTLRLLYFNSSRCSVTERRKKHITVNGAER